MSSDAGHGTRHVVAFSFGRTMKAGFVGPVQIIGHVKSVERDIAASADTDMRRIAAHAQQQGRVPREYKTPIFIMDRS